MLVLNVGDLYLILVLREASFAEHLEHLPSLTKHLSRILFLSQTLLFRNTFKKQPQTNCHFE